MFHAPRSRSLVLIFAVALLLSAIPATVHAGHSWGNYHWARTSNPFTVKLGDNVSSSWDSFLATTSSDWSASSVMNTTIVAGGTRPKSCRPTSGQVEVCNASYGGTGWLGVAQIWVSGDHITQCTAKMNDTYFNSSPYNTAPWKNLVMCQEVGHCFGLDHQDENFNNANLGTCMDYTNNPSGPPSNEHPNSHDYAQLSTIYSHLDSTTTVKNALTGMPPAMREIDLEGPAQWGKLVEVGNDGMTAVFEADFGGGNKVFTFVILALPEADERPDQPHRLSE